MPNCVLEQFHPAIQAWFAGAFAAPTPVQIQAWPAIAAGRHALIAAPTGSGKTLAAFLSALDGLVRDGIAGTLADETRVVYISPLKALSNDIHANLEVPLSGIRAELARLGSPDVEIRTVVRSGDTPAAERTAMRRRAPHIVVTTPESLYILLTSASGRKMLATTRSVIVDEIHALAPNKRGAHLALSLERLEALAGREIARIGLSATQKPIEDIARFLVGDRSDGAGAAACAIVDTGHRRDRDLAIEVPPVPLEAVMSGTTWQLVYERLAQLAREHRTTLIFVNTRRLAERAARHLTERLGADNVAAHHGSLARDVRLDAEQRLKRGELRALVATASLELGIDIGDVDLVCQLGVTRSIATLLQRVGRSGHAVGGTPKGRLFPLSRDELCDSAALLDAVRRGELDRIELPRKPLDVLAQQIVAEVALQEWDEDQLLARFRRALPYRDLAQAEFAAVVRMLADGFDTRRGRRSAYLHRDAVHRVLRGRRGAALSAVTSGGTIPDMADYSVVLEPQAQVIGTLNEDFAIESLAGDVFQLGNRSYRILRVERGTVRVEDAKGVPPGMPFWLGEAPGRSAELSHAVSRLRAQIAGLLDARGSAAALDWLGAEVGAGAGIPPAAAQQIVDYLAAAKAALGALPTLRHVILERFFDESGGMQLVLHAPFGSRINRAWGLALRKRFCRKFDFELQAAATEDAIVLSLASSHSFPLAEVAHYLSAASVRPLLVQALLAAPMFPTRWRWDATIALALPRMRGGRKVAPQLQRMASEDLLAAVFPDQLACGENMVGDREVPDHPLVQQTIDDCLHEAMDIDGLEQVLGALENGAIAVGARDLTEPSPLALEILAARPYAFLDDAPLEERRTQAVLARRWIDPATAADIGRLDAEAIDRVRGEVWPSPRSADELHDALLSIGFVAGVELDAHPDWRPLAAALVGTARAAWLEPGGGARILVATERLPQFEALFPAALPPAATGPDPAAAAAGPDPAAAAAELIVPPEYRRAWDPQLALVEVLRDRLSALGPVTVAQLVAPWPIDAARTASSLRQLEAEGTVMRGHYTAGATDEEWCERRILARIHRYTVNRLRRDIEPVEARDFMRFLFHWQRVAPAARVDGADAVAGIVSQLEGFEAPAVAWETEILPSRINQYEPAWLDEQSHAGRVAWARIAPARAGADRTQGLQGALPGRATPGPLRTTPIVLASRRNLDLWTSLAEQPGAEPESLTPRAAQVAAALVARGALFFDELVETTGLLRSDTERALAELVAQGAVHADGFGGLRALLVPSDRRRSFDAPRQLRRTALFGIEDAGRWALVRPRRPAAPGQPPSTLGAAAAAASAPSAAVVEHVARTLLRRYGVVFWHLIAREADWLPPWRELLRCLRRLEARGEVRGGRFVAGVSGEQFALADTIPALRDARREPRSGALIGISAADPLNLVGVLTTGPRLPALTGNRVLYRDGVPIALNVAGSVRMLEALEPQAEWAARNALLRRAVPPMLRVLG